MKDYVGLVDGLIEDYQRPRVKLDKGNGEFHLRTMLQIVEWAFAQQPIQPGMTVDIDPGRIDDIHRAPWWHWRDAMRHGPHPVVSIDFNGYWFAEVSIDDHTFAFPMNWLTAREG